MPAGISTLIFIQKEEILCLLHRESNHRSSSVLPMLAAYSATLYST